MSQTAELRRRWPQARECGAGEIRNIVHRVTSLCLSLLTPDHEVESAYLVQFIRSHVGILCALSRSVRFRIIIAISCNIDTFHLWLHVRHTYRSELNTHYRPS